MNSAPAQPAITLRSFDFLDSAPQGPQDPSLQSSPQAHSLQALNNHGGNQNSNGAQQLGPQSPSANLSLHGFNNHRALRNPVAFERNGRGDSDHNLIRRNERSSSPRPRNTGGFRTTDSRGYGGRDGAPNPTPHHQSRDAIFDNRSGEELSLYASPLSSQSLLTFEAMSDEAGLDPECHAIAMAQAQVYGDNNRYLAQAITHGRLLMAISDLHQQVKELATDVAALTQIVQAMPASPQSQRPNSTASQSTSVARDPNKDEPWTASKKLLSIMNPLALKLLDSPQLQAYTALSNEEEGFLPQSLFNTIKLTIAKEGVEFTSQHLPEQHQGVEEASGTTKYYSAIKECGKRAREKIHNLLLTGIHVPKKGENVGVPVPHLMELVRRVRIQCGTVGANCLARVVWDATDLPTRARIAYLRREAARIILKGKKGSESIWANVDEKLSQLRLLRNEDYVTTLPPSFYNIVCEEDYKYFDGQTFFSRHKENNLNLDCPSHETIMERMNGELSGGTGDGSGDGSVNGSAESSQGITG
ncbi:hypothetical protein DFH28DRAFT_1153447 [Melampsora americana]|nr:hypothetical protein DFH28DRAFT_1153447 [Melampsora americana]